MQTVQLIYDSLDVQYNEQEALGEAEIEVMSVRSCKEAELALERHEFQLVLLDLVLPDGNGLDFCSRFQSFFASKSLPVILLTGSEDVSHKVAAFALGVE